jgi:hypothetical protein
MFCPVSRFGLITKSNTVPVQRHGAPFQTASDKVNQMTDYQCYEQAKRTWACQHTDATPDQLEQAFRSIADRLGI